jgi:hypothetical protein
VGAPPPQASHHTHATSSEPPATSRQSSRQPPVTTSHSSDQRRQHRSAVTSPLVPAGSGGVPFWSFLFFAERRGEECVTERRPSNTGATAARPPGFVFSKDLAAVSSGQVWLVVVVVVGGRAGQSPRAPCPYAQKQLRCLCAPAVIAAGGVLASGRAPACAAPPRVFLKKASPKVKRTTESRLDGLRPFQPQLSTD